MKILFLNAWDTSGGAARAACRLLRGIQDAGLDASMLVKDKTSADPTILGPKTFDKILGLLRPRLEGRLVRRYPQWNGLTFTPALFPDRLIHQVSKLDPDIIHLHWMADGFLRLETLAHLNRPIVWTLHDSWPLPEAAIYRWNACVTGNHAGNALLSGPTVRTIYHARSGSGNSTPGRV
jgi:hypothetical protein